MNVLILGCGSIGSRHARNARLLGAKKLVLVDPNLDRARSLGAEVKTESFYSDYKTAVKEHPDLHAAFVCTPTSIHIRPAIFFARHKIHVFIEKPLSDSLAGMTELSELKRKNKVVVMMGHSLMFEPGFQKLKSYLAKKVIGKVYFASYLQGQYLPDWHPREDYKKEYSARSDLGGGAMLTLTSHNFYVLEWLFGPITGIRGAFVGRIGDLHVDVDDTVFLLLETKAGIPIQSQNNFIVPVHHHRLIVEGSKGTIEMDFANQKITVALHGKNPLVLSTKSEKNSRFVDEMRYFMRAVSTGKVEEGLDLESGVRFLNMARRARKVSERVMPSY